MKKTPIIAVVASVSFSAALFAEPVKLTCNASKALQDKHFSENISAMDNMCDGNAMDFACKMKKDLQRWQKVCKEAGLDWHHQLVTYFDNEKLDSKEAQQVVNNCWQGKAKNSVVEMSVDPEFLYFGALSVDRKTLQATRATEKYYYCELEKLPTSKNKV